MFSRTKEFSMGLERKRKEKRKWKKTTLTTSEMLLKAEIRVSNTVTKRNWVLLFHQETK